MNPATKSFLDKTLQDTIGIATRVPEQDPNANLRNELMELAKRRAAVKAKLQADLNAASNKSFASHVPNQVSFKSAPGSVNSAAFQTALQKMIAASGGQLSIKSGTRTTQRQAQLWADALRKYGSPERARKWVAPPGRSKHEVGLAADLGGNLAWAHANAAKYGLYFPLPHERWHIELRGSR